MKIHIWEISGYGKLNQRYTKFLEQIIRQRYNSIRKFGQKCEVSRRIIARACQREGTGFIKIKSLFKFTDFLDLERNNVEENIELYKDSRVGAYGRVYKLSFPFIITPKIIRLVSHIVGDGSVYEDEIKYSQKDATYIRELSESIVKPLGKLGIRKRYENGSLKEQVFSIPMIVAKCVSKYFDISLDDFKKHTFIEKCLELPKDFKVQVLAAIMIDDGCVSKKSIFMTDKKIIEKICKLIDSIGYKRSDITTKNCKNEYKGKSYTSKTYGVVLFGKGIRNFSNDLKKGIKKYGPLLSLWHKQSELENTVKSHNYNWLKKVNKSRELKREVISLAKKEKLVQRRDLIKKFDVKPYNIDYILKFLLQKNKIKRIDSGVYKYVK